MKELSTQHRLATYGTLAPGKTNHHELSELEGSWLTATVRGIKYETGWGAALGCPGMVPDEDGELIAVSILQSPDLPKHWARLDAFEGEEYVRTEIAATLADGSTLSCFIYRLARAPA